ncbi:MAG: GntR family transcriptional regulator [Treponema sp.]|jgi:DNA-binding GntR family transcriptional regulator|nr:GntR family transcriptional regulator [Treponema sp.]
MLVQDSVYAALRKSIINLNLLPGTAISEKEISLRYNVSRTPVREAFIHLSKEGLVEVFPQKETLVSPIDYARVEQELFLREHLEAAVLDPFIAKSGPEDFARLEGFIEKQTAAFTGNDYVNFMIYDNDFHRVLFETAGQKLSGQVLESMGGHYYRVRLLSTWLNGIPKSIISQHRALLGSFKKKDLSRARTLLDEHLHQLPTELELLQEKYPPFFAVPREKLFDVDFGGFPPKTHNAGVSAPVK